jgi:hypothetical protein
MVTTPADIDSLKVYVLTATHAINGVASIVAFAMLVFALVATYELQARAAGVLGVIGLGAAILGTVFMAGDWWYEAFAVPRLAEVAPEVMDTFARSRLLVGGLTSFVLFGIGWVLYGIASVRARVFPAAISWAIVAGGLLSGVPIGLVYLPGASSSGLPSSRSGRGGCVQATHEIFATHARRPSPARRVQERSVRSTFAAGCWCVADFAVGVAAVF